MYLSITDAMGHDADAALLVTLTVGTLRNRRRAVASPAEQADAANEALRAHAASQQFVTGLLMRIRLADGTAQIVDAGHPAPFLVRDGAVIPWSSPFSCLSASPQPPTALTP
jgi:serine phosphatase RsbU (regulator of sigma subunit)